MNLNTKGGLYLCQYVPFPAYVRIDDHDSSDANWICVRHDELITEARAGYFLWKAFRWITTVRFPPVVE